FEDVAAAWGLMERAYSTGAAYADFDNDGDLDLVINNLNDEAQLYENQTNPDKSEDAKFIRVNFKGVPGNPQGVGAKIWVYSNGVTRYAEQQLQRGYLSSVDPVMHMGLGSTNAIDSLLVVWPGDMSQVLHDVPVSSVVTVSYNDAKLTRRRVEEHSTLLAEDADLPLTVQQ